MARRPSLDAARSGGCGQHQETITENTEVKEQNKMDKFVTNWKLGPPSEAPDLTAIAHAATVTAMVEWFFVNFEEPAQNMPRDDGEWVYVWGGPYYARDELESAFPTADKHALDAAVYRIEAEDWEWAPASSRMQPEETA